MNVGYTTSLHLKDSEFHVVFTHRVRCVTALSSEIRKINKSGFKLRNVVFCVFSPQKSISLKKTKQKISTNTGSWQLHISCCYSSHKQILYMQRPAHKLIREELQLSLETLVLGLSAFSVSSGPAHTYTLTYCCIIGGQMTGSAGQKEETISIFIGTFSILQYEYLVS